MRDIFEQKILCNKCGKEMKKIGIIKDGFSLRAIKCPLCNEILIHPLDEQEYNKFKNLKEKEFRVKMRIVGNSYAVSIPKKIVSFMQEMDNQLKGQKKIMDEMVKLCFEDFGKLSLDFGFEQNKKNLMNWK